MRDRRADKAAGLRATLSAWRDDLFAERQVLLRSNGRVRYVTLSSRFQQIVVGLVLVALFAGGWWTERYFHYARLVEVKNSAIEAAQNAYRGLYTQFADVMNSAESVSRDLERKEQFLASLSEQNEALKQHLEKTQSQLTLTEAEKARIAAGRIALRQRLDLLEESLRGMGGTKERLEDDVQVLKSQLRQAETEKAQIELERTEVEARSNALQQELAQAAQRSGALEQHLQNLRGDLRKLFQERTRAAEENDKLQARIKELEKINTDMVAQHREQLKKYTWHSDAIDRFVERQFAGGGQRTPSVEELIQEGDEPATPAASSPERGGQGGPFIAAPVRPRGNETDPVRTLLASLRVNVGQAAGVRAALKAIPLLAPLPRYSLMSGYGSRMDPFNGELAMHYGVDLSGPLKSPVYSTADGVVVFAGWKSSYGRLVELDHGRGMRTRYAHLHRVDVTPGQKVRVRQQVGLLGSSGRSTGPHVHYEVLVGNVARDPIPFLKAGRHVFKE
jgi:murein DD-endopeptidase MepM/ murein hydrolase activator NlpD